MGADAVVYQDLPSLKTACATAAVRRIPETPKDFEVGVFSGSYITPVESDYFGHLERVRQESRRMKGVDTMRSSTVSNPLFSVPLNGPPNGDSKLCSQPSANGDLAKFRIKSPDMQDPKDVIQDRQDMVERHVEVRDQQDISLHNMNDQ